MGVPLVTLVQAGLAQFRTAQGQIQTAQATPPQAAAQVPPQTGSHLMLWVGPPTLLALGFRRFHRQGRFQLTPGPTLMDQDERQAVWNWQQAVWHWTDAGQALKFSKPLHLTSDLGWTQAEQRETQDLRLAD